MIRSIQGMALTAALGCMALPAVAQSAGEADSAQSRAVPSAAASRQDRLQAREARRTEGAAASHALHGDEEPSSMGAAGSSTPAERKAAAAQRKSGAAEALKRNEIPYGEK